MSSFDWKRIQRLMIPEGRVKQVRRGAQILWTSVYSLLESVLRVVSRTVARGRGSQTAPARVELALTDTEALAEPGQSAAAQSALPACPESRAAVISRTASRIEAAQREKLALTATVWSKARSVARSAADCMAEPVAASLSRGSAPAEAKAESSADILARVCGPTAVPGGFALEHGLDPAVQGSACGGRPAAGQVWVRPGFDFAAVAPEGAQGGCVVCSAPGFDGVPTAAPAGRAESALAPVQMYAAVRVAESWVYPPMPSSGCICPLTRVRDAARYETRVGGNGLELR